MTDSFDDAATLPAAKKQPDFVHDEPLTRLLSGRYRLLGEIAHGGGGRVLRVHDSDFNRVVAMKLMHREYADRDLMRRRFVNEAAITAQLQHPAIVGVHERGELSDGRLWYTMKEVRGHTLTEVIERMGQGDPRWPFRRVIDAFARLAQALGYAHQVGIMHRDVKPDNLMVGQFGEVMVMDWGLARRSSDAEQRETEGDPQEPQHGALLTQHGDVIGTPAYMSPEQARGDPTQHGPTTDVYSLGAVLYHLLAGRPPFAGSARAIWRRLASGRMPPPVEEVAQGRVVPAELAEITMRELSVKQSERYATAAELADQILVWLDGARRRERALSVLRDGDGELDEAQRLQQSAGELERQAREALADIRPSDPLSAKVGAWRLEDQAAEHRRDAAVHETNWLEAAAGALTIDPELPLAHARLARYYRARLLQAERGGDMAEAARCETLLRTHDRGENASFLSGEGRVTLLTEPAGAEVRLHRFVLRDRQLVSEPQQSPGATPLSEVSLMHGSYLLELHAPGHHVVRYPIFIERGGFWDSVPPEHQAPQPIVLPRQGELAGDDVYVPAGWCWTGGDDAAPDGVLARCIWIDGFVMKRHPVTNGEYLAFLNDLVERGRQDDARRYCPGSPEKAAGFAFERGADGRYALGVEHDGQRHPHWPVVMVSWRAAKAYCEWFAAREGRAWRLPHEYEREKAARGVDGRLCTWGNHLDPAFTISADSSAGALSRVDIGSEHIDKSPYAIYGLCGHTSDWCANIWQPTGLDMKGRRLLVEAAGEAADEEYRAIRGGAWATSISHARAAARYAAKPDRQRASTGFRLVRSYPPQG